MTKIDGLEIVMTKQMQKMIDKELKKRFEELKPELATRYEELLNMRNMEADQFNDGFNDARAGKLETDHPHYDLDTDNWRLGYAYGMFEPMKEKLAREHQLSDALHARIAELEAENAALKAKLNAGETVDEWGKPDWVGKETRKMKIAKDCPFCGEDIGPVVARQGTKYTFYQVMHQPNKKGHRHGLIIMDVDEWNTRPIEDALNARIAELRDVIGDYRNDASRVLDEKCPSDERHCGCVPILRDQLNKYQKALILITTMPELSQATIIAREALQERGKFIWSEQSVGEYWVTKLDILQDKFDTLEKDYAYVCQKRLEAADVFSRQIIELEAENAALKKELKNARIAELEAEIDQLTAHSDIERQDDKSPNDTQTQTIVYGKECEE